MRIFEVTFKLSSGGAERFVVDLSNSLSKKHEVSLITIKNDENERSHFYQKDLLPEIDYINYNIPSGISIKGLIILYKLIKNNKPDIVHFHVSNIIVYFILPILFPYFFSNSQGKKSLFIDFLFSISPFIKFTIVSR